MAVPKRIGGRRTPQIAATVSDGEVHKKMRKYEESVDVIIPKDMYIVARLDGRSFSRLSEKVCRRLVEESKLNQSSKR